MPDPSVAELGSSRGCADRGAGPLHRPRNPPIERHARDERVRGKQRQRYVRQIGRDGRDDRQRSPHDAAKLRHQRADQRQRSVAAGARDHAGTTGEQRCTLLKERVELWQPVGRKRDLRGRRRRTDYGDTDKGDDDEPQGSTALVEHARRSGNRDARGRERR